MDNFNELLNVHISNVNIPRPQTKVYKDECVYSFDTPFTDTGLYVCLKTFFGLGKEHLERHHRKTGGCVYLHMKYEKVLIEHDETEPPEEKKVTRLAIGVQGGFDADPSAKKFDTRKNYSVVILPQLVIVPWPNDALPEKIIKAVNGIIEAESAYKLMELESEAWDGEIRCVSKHANDLLQLDNNKRIPPTGWKCEKCDLTNNLWLNLTDGSILCGRKFFDGSGGNDHALHHFNETKYPLAVKLGTITKDGKADVFSYDEDDMVEDPKLIQHLAHFGINITNMEKTDKSMVELELDLNQKFGEWAAIQESGSNLQPLYGPGYTGLNNLGNSCYINSTMQVMFTIQAFITKYVENSASIFDNVTGNPSEDFTAQMAKLGVGLLSGKYSRPPVNEIDNSFSVSPTMFKNVVGRGHPVFCSKNQQDVQEFFLYFLSHVQRNSRNEVDPTDAFKFKIEERYECNSSGKVHYQYRDEYCLPVAIPMDAAKNRVEVEAYVAKQAALKAGGIKPSSIEVVRPIIDFSSCLENFTEVESVDQFYSSAIKKKTTAFKTTRLCKFPQFLVVHLKKCILRENWTPMKLDVCIDMPDKLDLYALKGKGMQPGEELLPVDEPVQEEFQYNDQFFNQLMDMGFPIEACKRALYETKNVSLDGAACWVMEHLDDPSITEPFNPPKTASTQGNGDFMVDEIALATIMSLGFSRNHGVKALRETGNNVERAADWVFNHPDETDGNMEVVSLSSSFDITHEPDIPTNYQYQLRAFISHMGTSSHVGHYVCHILKEGKWVIFNDEKVARSENPPKGLGYLYFYERVTGL